MPRLDGIEAARRILAERPIPIVMLTAYGQDELVARAVEAGVFGYLVKPFRETDLLPGDPDRARASRGARDAARRGRVARRGACDSKGGGAGQGDPHGARGLSENDAFVRLRRASQSSGRPLRVVAEAAIATFDVTDSASAAAGLPSSWPLRLRSVAPAHAAAPPTWKSRMAAAERYTEGRAPGRSASRSSTRRPAPRITHATSLRPAC